MPAFGDKAAEWWLSNVSTAAAVASISRPAAGQQDPPLSHYITRLSASYSAAQIGLLTIASGGQTIHSFYVHNFRDILFDAPLRIPAGQDVTITLAAGGVGIIGAVNADGFTAE